MNQDDSHTTVSNRWAPLLILFVYSVLISFLSAHHELWRDEVRAWSFIHEMGSLGEFFATLRSEGHPFGWYAVLYAADFLLDSPTSLKFAAVSIALLAAFLLLRSPEFSLLEKTLWLLGVFPLYEYSVQCRNYGLGMLFLFLYCSLYNKRKLHPLWAALTLLLLANSSAVAFLLAASLLGIRVLRLHPFFARKEPEVRGEYLAIAIAAAGLLLTAWSMRPVTESLVTTAPGKSPAFLLQGLLLSIITQANFATDAFSIRFYLPALLVIAPLYFLLRRNLLVCAYVFSSLTLIGILHHLVYPASALRHQGFVLLVVISAVWLYRKEQSTSERKRLPALNVFLLPVLLLQIDGAYLLVTKDVRQQITPAPAAAALIKNAPDLRNAIIIAEPDYYVETLRYHLNNRIYLPREKRFRSFVSFTSENAQKLSLGELIKTAAMLEQTYSVPVVLLYGHRYPENGEHQFSYEKLFTITAPQRKRFRKRFELLKEFEKGVSDEEYTLYRFKPQRPKRKYKVSFPSQVK